MGSRLSGRSGTYLRLVVVGGWYGGASGLYDSNTGSGGSGFVWTAETASNVPSGYSVATKYYLTNAGTYGGNTTFAAPNGGTETGHEGDGYARITLISATKTVGTASKWISIEEQIENGSFTGSFDYNGHTITVIDTKNEQQTYQE